MKTETLRAVGGGYRTIIREKRGTVELWASLDHENPIPHERDLEAKRKMIENGFAELERKVS